MKPEVRRRAQGAEIREAFVSFGIPEEWTEPLISLGYDSVEKLKEVEKSGRLANELNGYNKKNKLGLQGVSPETVALWLKNCTL